MEEINIVDVPAKSNLGHMNLLLQVLAQSQPGGETSLGKAVQAAAAKVKRRGMIVLISDCFDNIENLMKALSFFRHHGHDVVVLQI